MSYRPITDVWMLCRSKVAHSRAGGYYGAFPAGFLERARFLLGVTIFDPVLHVCGGAVKDYQSGPMKGKGLGPNDRTVDLNPGVNPDFLLDVRTMGTSPGDTFPFWRPKGPDKADGIETGVFHIDPESDGPEGAGPFSPTADRRPWAAALLDRPYTDDDADEYVPGREGYPRDVNDLLRRSLSVTRVGGRVGIIDYIWPKPPKDIPTILVATIMVTVGWNNRVRCFTVYERAAYNPLEYNVLTVDGSEAPQEPQDEPDEDEGADEPEAEEEAVSEPESAPEPPPPAPAKKKAKKKRARERPSLTDGFGA